ncbi:MFS general substrate transporter [Poronia punctata]|nr:MFS general substrate transporter [Poronia punctata]
MDSGESSYSQEEKGSLESLHVGNKSMPQNLASLSKEDYARLSRRATLKLDLVMMPILLIMYVLNYLDRQNIASARLAGLQEDLGMTDVQYQTAVSILFIGYILAQTPSNLLASKITWPGIYICMGMAAWGAMSALTAVVHDFSHLLAIRALLGVIEAIFFPGALFLLSQFYNRKQFALRTAILYSGSQIGNAVGGLFAIGILQLDGQRGLSGWRWLFLIEGISTVVIASIFSFFLPNSHQKKIIFLTPLEHEFIRYNYTSDHNSNHSNYSDEETSSWKGFVLAISDPKLWLITGILYCTYTVGTVVNFFPSVIQSLGYPLTTTYGLTCPPFVLCILAMLFNGWHSDRSQERFYHILTPLLLCLVTNIILLLSPANDIVARYFAIVLLPGCVYAATVVALSWLTTNMMAGPAAKKAAAIAVSNSIYNTPNIWGSYLFFGRPRYLVAFGVFVGVTVLAAGFAVGARVYLVKQNRKLDNRGEEGEGLGRFGPTREQVEKGFRFTL